LLSRTVRYYALGIPADFWVAGRDRDLCATRFADTGVYALLSAALRALLKTANR